MFGAVGEAMNIYKPVVFLVDDDPSILKALPRALSQHGLEVEAYSSAIDFLDSYTDKPGCLILDLSMPEMTGLELQTELSQRNINIPIIFITGHGGVPQSVQALRAGAIDFLEKPFLPEILLQRIDEALAQDHRDRARTREEDDIRLRFARLTDRERDVFRKLVEGNSVPSSKAMARELDISHRTVEHHRSRILEKTQTASVPELRALVKEVGLDLSEV